MKNNIENNLAEMWQSCQRNPLERLPTIQDVMTGLCVQYTAGQKRKNKVGLGSQVDPA